MREIIIKLTAVLAALIMFVAIAACDSEAIPLWASVIGIMAPAGYLVIVAHANHWEA